MMAALKVSKFRDVVPTTEQMLQHLLMLAARALGLSKKHAQEAAEIGNMRVDGVQISVSCLETDAQQDAIIVAKLAVPCDPAAIRHLLEINLIAAIAMHSTIAIDCDGQAILLSLVPIGSTEPSAFASRISEMALFANTLEAQLAR
jgi:hypothetical protein